jgi:hypothetical protein
MFSHAPHDPHSTLSALKRRHAAHVAAALALAIAAACAVALLAGPEAIRQAVAQALAAAGGAVAHAAWASAPVMLLLGAFGATAGWHALRQFALARACHRAACLAITPASGTLAAGAPWSRGLLPSQRHYVEDFLRELLQRPHEVYSAKITAVEGIWGSGKTTVVQAMRRALETDPAQWGVLSPAEFAAARERLGPREFIPAFLNAWRDENPEDLHERLVERILLVPRVLLKMGFRGSGLSWRMLWSMSTPLHPLTPTRPWWRPTKLKGALSRKSGDSEAKAEVEFNPMPSRLTHQEDVESIVARLRCAGADLVLFVDELDRGTPKSAQAMLVMLRRSLDLPGVHLVVPYVPDVLGEIAFNPLQHESPELASASLAVLASADRLVRGAERPLHRLSADAYRHAGAPEALGAFPAAAPAAMPPGAAPAPAPGAAAGAGAGAGAADGATPPSPPKEERGGPLARRDRRRDAFHDRLLSGFLALARPDRETLQRRMSEKYIGFFKPLPRPDERDLIAFVWSQTWLRVPAKLDGLLAGAIAGATGLPPARAHAVVAALYARDEQPAAAEAFAELAARRLRFLLDPQRGGDRWPLLGEGRFAWRSFEPYVPLLLAGAGGFDRIAWPDFGLDDTETAPVEEQAAAFAFAQLVFTALGLYGVEQAAPGTRG